MVFQAQFRIVFTWCDLNLARSQILYTEATDNSAASAVLSLNDEGETRQVTDKPHVPFHGLTTERKYLVQYILKSCILLCEQQL